MRRRYASVFAAAFDRAHQERNHRPSHAGQSPCTGLSLATWKKAKRLKLDEAQSVKKKFRPTLLELLIIVGILGIVCGLIFPITSHDHWRPVREQEMFGYWVSMPEVNSAYRLCLTNGGSGLLGVRDIYTNLWSVVSWQVTNRDISIELAPVTFPDWPHEYIRGKVGFGQIRAVRQGINQDGDKWKREMIFYREDRLKQALDEAASVMTNQTSSAAGSRH